MSFLSLVREETVENLKTKNCCKKAQVNAILMGSGKYSDESLRIITENEPITQIVKNIFKKTYKIDIPVTTSDNSDKYIIKLSNKILNELNIDYLNALQETTQKYCCKKAFMQTLFLICGKISDPEKEYRIEFVLRDKTIFEYVNSFFVELGFAPKNTIKNKKYILYFKDCSSLEDILTYINATDCSLKLMEIEVEKTVKNNTNRKANFEQANFCKTYDIAQKQINAIKLIKKKGVYSNLNDNLKFVALLREQNDDASLNDLAQISGISRSSINKRLNKLLEIAEDLED